jgi:gamma-glutamyltranspeptidase/glutathione hydrolase
MKQMFTIFSQRCGLFVRCIALAVAVVTTLPLSTEAKPRSSIFQPILAEYGMVSAQEAVATRIGVEILQRGGNAVDAAVAVGFALSVTLPRAGNLGGGGFMMVHEAATGETHAIDYREAAPAAATRGMFLDAAGEYDRTKAVGSHLSSGVPGTVAGLAMALELFGTMSLAEIINPALKLASEGIAVTRGLAESLTSRRKKKLARWPASREVFLKPDGSAYDVGEIWVQTDLAWSLEQIAENGPSAFYSGEIADRLVKEMAANGGLIEKKDLMGYRAILRQPVRGTYRGREIVSMPPPSSGGVHLIQMLNVMEKYDISEMGHNSAASIHVITEAMKSAYADRSWYLGDSDYWKVPVAGLTSKSYAIETMKRIDLAKARSADEIGPGLPKQHEGRNTTHFSVVDKDGNVVSNTYTLNLAYGNGIVAAGTGILLNNEMDDFSAKPGVANSYGLIGGEANAIEPGKRPLSSMTPTIVFQDGKPLLVTGSPGGSQIITTVLQVISNVIDHRMNIAAATAAPRFHHQWRPDFLRLETGFSADTLKILKKRGHAMLMSWPMGSTQSIMLTPKGLAGSSDPRRRGALTLGY